MVIPTSRDQLKEYCLRKVGKPLNEINIDDDQLDDRIDDAISYFNDYHFDGVAETYYKYQVQAADVTNKYITLPSNILGAIEVFNVGDPSVRVGDLFNIRYQIALNDLYTLTSVSVVPYYMTRMHLSLLAEILVGKYPIRFNRYTHQLFIDTDWSGIPAGIFLVIKAYLVVDPTVYTDMWNDQWLKRYATALIKRQYGTNLKKFVSMTLPGGIQFNGQQIYDEADGEIKELEHEMIHSYSLPVTDLVG